MFFNDQDERPVELSNVGQLLLDNLVKNLQVDIITKMDDTVPKLDHRNVSITSICIEKSILHQYIDDLSTSFY
jgi:hypothetical protein